MFAHQAKGKGNKQKQCFVLIKRACSRILQQSQHRLMSVDL